MKKINLVFIAAFSVFSAFSQVHDTGDKVGVGTTSPKAKLDIDEIGGSSGSLTALFLRSGNTATYNGNNQIALSYNGGTKYAHSIKTRHHSHQMENNAIDFYVWSPSDHPDHIGSSHVMSLNAGKVGIGTTSPEFILSLPDINSNISLGNNVFINGENSTGRITNNAYINNGWKIYDASAYASTIEIRDSGVIEMYGTTVVGQASWRKMFGFDAPNNVSYFPNGNVGIGTTNPDEKLTVKGKIHTEEVRVDLSVPGPDYVFEEDYDLTSLEEIEAFIQSKKHLPEVPSAKEMEANGVQLGEMNMLLLKKIEELTLYTIEQEKKLANQGRDNSELRMQNEELTQTLNDLLKRIEKLESK